MDERMLSRLDVCEDYPTLYDRIEIPVVMDDNKSLSCLCYFLVNHKPSLLTQTFLEDYRTEGSHGMPYDAELDDENDDYSDVQTV